MGNFFLISTFLKTLCNATPFTNSWTLVQRDKPTSHPLWPYMTRLPHLPSCIVARKWLILFLVFVCVSQHSWHPTSQTLVQDISNHYNTAPPSRQHAYQPCVSGISIEWYLYLQLLHYTPFVIVWVCKLVLTFSIKKSNTSHCFNQSCSATF